MSPAKIAAALAVAGTVLLFGAPNAVAGEYYVYSCSTYGNTAPVFQGYSSADHMSTPDECMQPAPDGGGRSLEISNPGGTVLRGYGANWTAYAPSGVTIVGAYTPINTVFVDCKLHADGFYGQYYWAGGAQSINYINGCNSSGYGYGDGVNLTISPGSFFFAFGASCSLTEFCATTNTSGAVVGVDGIQLTAQENTPPSIAALGSNNVWYTGTYPGNSTRWIRGVFPATVQDSDPSGVCDMVASFDNQPLQGPTATPNNTVFDQCDPGGVAQQWSFNIDTTGISSGVVPYALSADNAAGVWVPGLSENLLVDNLPVGLSLSGPTVASTASGTQYVVARASSGPSGVAIGCSVDGRAVQWHNGATDTIPVAGAGNHVVSCQGHNGAVNSSGQVAYSAPATWSLSIGQPTVSAIGFSKIADALKCSRVRERVKVPARWVTVRRHHKLVKVRKRAHRKLVTLERCHPRIEWIREKVWVKVRRHHRVVEVKRTRRVRVVLAPHLVTKAKERVAYGHQATVSGWLGTASGVAIAGAPVEILAAPNNGLGQFAVAAVTTTAANGGWSARVGAGPSRVIEAVYGGTAGLLPASSAPIELDVPARISLSVTPRRLPWSGVITLRGHLDGGYIPPDGVALRLLIKLPRRHRPYQPVPFRTDAQGNFVIPWSWGSGSGVATMPFAIATTATESDYPFSAARSGWIRVTFGLPTDHHHHRHHRRHAATHRRKR